MTRLSLFPEFLAPPQPDGASDEWYTPRWLLDWLPPVGFDPCWAPESNVRPAVGWDVRSGHNGMLEPWPDVPASCSATRRTPTAHRGLPSASARPTGCSASSLRWCLAMPETSTGTGTCGGRARWVGFIAGRIRFDTLGGRRAKDAASFTSALVCWGPAEAAGTVLRTVRERAAGQRGLWTVNAMTPHAAEPDDDDCSCDDCNGIDADAEPEETVSEPLPPAV